MWKSEMLSGGGYSTPHFSRGSEYSLSNNKGAMQGGNRRGL